MPDLYQAMPGGWDYTKNPIGPLTGSGRQGNGAQPIMPGVPTPAAAPPTVTSSGIVNPYLPASWYPGSSGSTGTSAAAGLPGTTTAGNLAAGPTLSSLTKLIDQLNQAGQTSSNANRIPGNPALEQQSSNNIASELSGQLPADVIRQITQAAAERGVATGSPGSDNSNANLLQSLGLNSLQLQQTGQRDLTAADARNPGAPLFDPTGQLLTPAQAGNLNLGQSGNILSWLQALTNPAGTRTGSGGGYGSYGGSGTGTGGGSSSPSTYQNLLYPPNDPSGAGVGGGGFTSPGSTYIPTNQDFSGLFGDPYAGYGDQPAGTVNTQDSSSYDPFSQYYGG